MTRELNTLAVSKEQEKIFERGFKTWCENTAETLRARLGLGKNDPLSPYDLASHLGVKIIDLDKVPNLNADTIKYLSSKQGDEWSAVTVEANGLRITIVNPSHSKARQASNIMHELAHVIRGHKSAQVYLLGEFALREFDVKQESEADWFAGCLLLPRTALISSAYRNEAVDEAIERLGVSKSLFTYRTNKTGVKRQLSKIRS